ncbi:MAG: 1-deoxy-D-xylulose-5-phosphate reductoisomerase [Nitrospirae bacterium]|nr:1-deoxy-D-xylulose-5-phosphate reductoisomerase [Nitrospirota bacterium]
MKNISVLGSTGSIGKATLEIVRRFPRRFKVVGLAAKNNIELLTAQIRTFKPEIAAVHDESAARELKKKNLPAEIVGGEKGLIEAATLAQAEIVVSAIAGSAALIPTYEAVKAGKTIALASKETLVMAGSIIMAEAMKRKVRIIPVDSEHSAVFQCINGRRMDEVSRIILTASGGPFLREKSSGLRAVTPAQALKHPNWEMGRKITIDSATLMNKGLEVIEACWLFNVTPAKVDVLIHPQSIVHSMVEFIDGSVMAQMSVPDMKGPICYALSIPERCGPVLPSLDLSETGELTFDKPDTKRFQCLALAYSAIRTGKTMPSVLNAANEVAVEAFLDRKISFTEIPDIVLNTMKGHKVSACRTIKDVVEASDWAKRKALQIVESRRNRTG